MRLSKKGGSAMLIARIFIVLAALAIPAWIAMATAQTGL